MKVLVKIPMNHFDGLLKKCDLARPEYLILKNGVITRNNDDLGIAEISCQLVSAKRLFELAVEIYPDAAPYIGSSLLREL
jgi:hypothetical protein